MAQRKDRGDHTFLPARGDRLCVQVSFKEFGGDYEQAIRGQKDDAQIYSLANKAIVREGLELWVAKDTLLQLRDQCLENLDQAMAEVKRSEANRESLQGHYGKANSGEVENEDQVPDGVGRTLYCAWAGGREKSLIVKLAKMSVSYT